METHKAICIIPARGGSKRIPRKNIRDFHGKPVIQYAIEAARQSELFSEIMVSTDDKEIAAIAIAAGVQVPFMRSDKASDDMASTVDVLLEVLSEYKKMGEVFTHVCCLYPVTPLTTSLHLQNGWNQLMSGVDSVFPILPYSFPIWRSFSVSENTINWIWPEHSPKRSQDLPTAYHDAGQWYWIKTALLLENQQLLTDNTGFVLLSELEAQDVDNESDWQLMELKYKLQNVHA
jgi:pseudaminic acid cytidylyltransferase